MINEALINGALINGGGGGAAVPDNAAFVRAQGYAATASGGVTVAIGTVAPQGYAVSANLSGGLPVGNHLQGQGYAASVRLEGGGEVAATGYGVSASGVAQGDNVAHIAAQGYTVGAAVSGAWQVQAGIVAVGYTVHTTLLGGAEARAQGYSAEAASTAIVGGSAAVASQGYAVSAVASVQTRYVAGIGADAGYAVSARLNGGAILAGGGYTVAGQAVADTPLAPFNYDRHDAAWVLNTATTESTRYGNFFGLSLLRLGGKDYLARHDGLYLLSGDDDGAAPVNGIIMTKDTDFGSYNAKRVPYCYLNSDTATVVRPYVDGVVKLPHTSRFKGRKTHLARGPSGRYWQFKVEGVVRLEGLEFTPQLAERQRRVK